MAECGSQEVPTSDDDKSDGEIDDDPQHFSSESLLQDLGLLTDTSEDEGGDDFATRSWPSRAPALQLASSACSSSLNIGRAGAGRRGSNHSVAQGMADIVSNSLLESFKLGLFRHNPDMAGFPYEGGLDLRSPKCDKVPKSQQQQLLELDNLIECMGDIKMGVEAEFAAAGIAVPDDVASRKTSVSSNLDDIFTRKLLGEVSELEGRESHSSSSDSEDSSDELEPADAGSEVEEVEESGEDITHLVEHLCHLVSSNNRQGIEKFLRKHDVLLQDLCLTSQANGESAVTLAGTLGLLKVLKLFSQLGVWLHHADSQGYMAIHRAAHNGHTKVVDYLTKLGQWDSKTKSGFTPLHIAATIGNFKMTKSLVSHVTDLNEACDLGWTSLHMASQGGHSDVVNLLLEHGVEVDPKNCFQETPLYIAAQNGHQDVIGLLLERGAEVNVQNDKGTTALYIAVQKKYITTVEFLLTHDACPNMQDNLGWAPIHKATHMADIAMMEVLLDHGADINLKNKKDINCLLLSSVDKLIKPLNVVIKTGVDVNAQDSAGWSALHSATQGHQVDTMKCLLSNGADANIKNNRSITPLYIAARKGFTDAVTVLLEHQADPNLASQCGWNPLHIACQFEHFDVVNLILEKGKCDAEAETADGSTPLSIAIDRRNKNLVDLFTQGKSLDLDFICRIAHSGRAGYLHYMVNMGYIDLKAKKNGCTVMHHAASTGDHLAVRTLTEAIVNVNVVDLEGNTPLHIACKGGHFNAVSSLLNAHSMVNAANNKLITPLQYAVTAGNKDIVMLLLMNGADVNTENEEKETSLSVAIKSDQPILVDLLLGHDSDALSSDTEPLTHLAAELGHTTVLSILQRHGANLGARDIKGETCLHLAASFGHLDTVIELVRQPGVDVNAKNILQMTPLHAAALKNHIWVVEALLCADTQVSLLDDDGLPVYELAKHKQIWELVKDWCKHKPNVMEMLQVTTPRERQQRVITPDRRSRFRTEREDLRLERVLDLISSARTQLHRRAEAD